MRLIGRALLVLPAAMVLVLGLVWGFGSREPVDTDIAFDPVSISLDLDAHLAHVESAFDDIVPGVEKRIVWAGPRGETTDEVVLYIHGFSATSEEIRPVPDRVASAIGANLLFWRLPGHGRTGAAMAEPSAGDWIEDTAHALKVAGRLGERVTVISTSTGGTLAALAAAHPDMTDLFDRVAFVSPNFEIANPLARILTWPGARWWAPIIAGSERSFTPANEAQARYWTTSYPTVATIPLGALVDHVRSLDFAGVTQPALFLFSDADQVVSAAATREIATRWGGDAVVSPQVPGPGDDPFNHVIAGDILSPGMTAGVVDEIVDFIRAN